MCRFSGLPIPLQFFRSTTLDTEDRSKTHLIVLSLELAADALAASDRVIGHAFPDALIAFVLEARRGHARATCHHPKARQHAPAIATSVAAVLAGASWDDSDAIVIELDSSRYDVSLENDGAGRWIAHASLETAAG